MNRMPERDTFERFLDDWLVAEAGARSPGYLDETMRRIDGVGQRRAWASLERWLPMTLLSARTTVAPPVRLILLLVVGLLAASLATGLAVIGSRVLRPTEPPDLHSGILVPTLQRDDAWSDDPRTDLDEPILGDIGPDGNLYVISGGTNEIVILDPDGHELRRFGGTGREPGRFDFQLAPSDPALKSIGGLAVAADGTIYVADTVNDRVQHVDSEGTVLGTWGGWGPGPGQFLNPIGVDIGPDGSVFVVDDDRNEIQRFRPDGEYLSTIGGPGSNPGQMSYTGFIALGADGTIYNADFGNDRLQSWTSDGSLRWWVGSSGRLPGQFTGPNDVDVDAEGNVYVTDAGRVQVYGSDGVLRSQFGVEGTGVDDGPLFVAIAPDGAAYLSLPAQDQDPAGRGHSGRPTDRPGHPGADASTRGLERHPGDRSRAVALAGRRQPLDQVHRGSVPGALQRGPALALDGAAERRRPRRVGLAGAGPGRRLHHALHPRGCLHRSLPLLAGRHRSTGRPRRGGPHGCTHEAAGLHGRPGH